ncbi:MULTISPECIES: FKBP-type peptidyl-prolyl cis-trans isomerase N-terminal domain-containing protein [unclassified Luteimonas]|uniref:FKBP-type peptidyl-prolyl cis-trans isomerase N-terminal domain-containing protein n=1 Tax=unclassified Luteimonas TaxID=2629088 RepID=UPI0018F06299|nr:MULTISPECIES: FKBP-type peptidyl-prolyl cis-trans isomerase N-terminal domain-containing protein [unclassified Luteimonas]MBJ6978300.1 FKBP-type peptidyl-prolyl cis-trans isomerase [Luteimonas sp. MC1895]MBJ6983919.1 FKBP-type peptidyl-prolyl cis-trans isomerase [Luteimonas sp. MC1750]QQO06737.1 FKBP-type peptidyl-prolyl cis-trans isomerase [Luteimonas sp. MC1750]
MKLRLLAAALAATTLVAGTAAAQDTSSEKGKLSYAIGYNTGAELAELTARGEAVDVNTVIKALQDAYGKKEPTVPVDQLRTAVENMQKRQQAKMEAEFRQLAAANKTASDTFLAQNKAKAGVQSLPGGVQYRVIETGNGAKPTQASDVQLTYKGSLPDGTVLVDTNQVPQGQTPGPVALKVSQVPLEGLREALLQMPAGSRWEVVMPGEKAYGSDIRAGRMANQAVVFDVKLVSVK